MMKRLLGMIVVAALVATFLLAPTPQSAPPSSKPEPQQRDRTVILDAMNAFARP